MIPLLAEHAHSVTDATPLMWAIWAAAFVASALSIWAAVRMTLHPGEEEPDHVKRSILDDDAALVRAPSPPAPPTASAAPDAPR